jgi:hypothetical protein
MMEETVPLASNDRSHGTSSHVQQRTSAAVPRASPAAAAATAATRSSNDDGDESDNTRRRNHNHSSMAQFLSSLSSPTSIISKIFLVFTILLKIALYPIRKVSHMLFPLGDFDGFANGAATDQAAKAFCKMFLESFIQPKFGMNNSSSSLPSTSAGTSNSSNGDNNSNGDDSMELLTSCPFINLGYSQTIEHIHNQANLHQQHMTNMTASSGATSNGASFYNDIPPAPPLLLIYLHSPFHSSTKEFCQDKLCSTRMLKYLNERSYSSNDYSHSHDNNIDYKSDESTNDNNNNNNKNLVCWGGSIHTADGKYVQNLFNVTAYPFLALVRARPQSNSSNSNNSSSSNNHNQNDNAPNPTKTNLELYLRIEGHKLATIQTNSLYTCIDRSIAQYSQTQNEDISRIIARQEDINLRSEQDREYREALEEAQRLERQREEETRQREEAERVLMEEERSKEEELNRAVKEKGEKLKEARSILELYGVEPDGSDKSDNCVRIRLMLPSGQRVERRFRGKETIDTVKSFLLLHFEEDELTNKIENFQLSSNYPKKALVNGSATLESEGLCPQAVIMVQDLDA